MVQKQHRLDTLQNLVIILSKSGLILVLFELLDDTTSVSR